jgi:hypothetical protein
LIIKNFTLLPTIFNLIYFNAQYSEICLNYIFILLKNGENRKIFIEQKNWQNFILRLMCEKKFEIIKDENINLSNNNNNTTNNNNISNKKEEKEENIYNLSIGILNLLVLESMLIKDGWKKFRDLLNIIELYEKKEGLSKDRIYNDIYNKIIPKLGNLSQKINKEKEDFFWKNLFHFIRMLQEYR